MGFGPRGRTDKITRPKQVLSEYGMTCYGTSVMYMIQSYGLVPPDMTREEFEYAFTPLNPKDPKRSGDPKTDSIRGSGDGAARRKARRPCNGGASGDAAALKKRYLHRQAYSD